MKLPEKPYQSWRVANSTEEPFISRRLSLVRRDVRAAVPAVISVVLAGNPFSRVREAMFYASPLFSGAYETCFVISGILPDASPIPG